MMYWGGFSEYKTAQLNHDGEAARPTFISAQHSNMYDYLCHPTY